MTGALSSTWHDANQRYLAGRLAAVRAALEEHIAGRSSAAVSQPQMQNEGAPFPLDTLTGAFGLSPFERDVLVMCAGMEIEASFAELCARANGAAERCYPTFGLALSALQEAHWSAITPVAPLRRWRLIETGAGETLTRCALRIDERVLHYLTGVSYADLRLHGVISAAPFREDVPPSRARAVARIREIASRRNEGGKWPVIQLCGNELPDKREVAAAACKALGIRLHSCRASELPVLPAEREAISRLWEREAILLNSALFLQVESADGEASLQSFLSDLQGMVFLATREPLELAGIETVRLFLGALSPQEQQGEWSRTLGAAADEDSQLEALVAQFRMTPEAMRAAARDALESANGDGTPLRISLWNACRVHARRRMDELAQRIEPAAGWEDLVLPQAQREVLRQIAAQVRQRATVYERWNFLSKGSRGLGITTLFAGASGTGKTMAAEVLANELRLDLYRIDLSQVVSKYIGETEKNLRRVFTAAEEGGAVLLFDEADALFGKRSEVKDSHDRYANIEVSYLLQHMEAYRGLAILTTNMKGMLDQAFLRRLRFVVQFPFPDLAQRAEIWSRVFPAETPVRGLEWGKLARLSATGGTIRNIALNGAFLAAEEGEPVQMSHLLRAARSEYAKLEKPLAEAESAGWV